MTGLLITGLIIILALWAVALYNSLVTLRQRNRQAFADIDVQLRQRHDLVPNLVETVKGYARHERETMDAVIQARNAAVSAKGPAQQAEAENALSSALGRLFALAEAYPDLKANQIFSSCSGSSTTSRTSSRRQGASSTAPRQNTTPSAKAFRQRSLQIISVSRHRISSTSARTGGRSSKHRHPSAFSPETWPESTVSIPTSRRTG
jgi:hypothetical protein